MTDDISLILATVLRNCGVDFSLYRENTLRRRINRRCMAHDCDDLHAYLSVLESDPCECDRLLRDLTIKYTEFCRDPHVFQIVRNRIIPTLLDSQHKARVWSAGCATGEETYSIAALMARAGAFQPCHSGVTVVGTDLDTEAIEVARLGVYLKNCLPNQPGQEVLDYFFDDGMRLVASPELKEMVRFGWHNLLAATAADDLRSLNPEGFDLILCRNVLIYLHRAAQASVVRVCLELLRPAGFIVLGAGETFPKSLMDEVDVIDEKARIYRARPVISEGLL